MQAQTAQLPKLAFEVESAQAVEFAAAPTLAFALRVTSDLPVRSLALNTQIRIAPARRRYSDADRERLVELFGPPERWGETLRTFYGLDDGDVPLELLFSGPVFYLADGGRLQTAQIPWESEAAFRLPVRVWKAALEAHFPHSAWLRVRDDTFARLAEYKSQHALPTWEAT